MTLAGVDTSTPRAGMRLPSSQMLDALRRRPALHAPSVQAWDALSRQGDAANAERWAANVLALLHANAGVACIAALLRLRGTPAMLADLAAHVTEICRHAGATAAIACIDAWERLRAPGLWPGLRRLAREAPDCVAPAASNAGTILQALGADGLVDFVSLGLKGAGRDKARRVRFFALTDPLAQHALARAGGGFTENERRLKLFGTALWGRLPALLRFPAPPPDRLPARRASLSDGVVLLPESFPGVPPTAQAPLFRAAVAHALAHLMAGAPRQPVGTLKPLQLVLIGLIEDARVEALAIRRFPGLRRLWAPFHVAQPEGGTAPVLFARLARALFDPQYRDPHGFIAKGLDLFAASDLNDPKSSRRIGGLLGNDLGQMRVQFNARSHVVEPAYRDDNLGLWDFAGAPADAAPEILEMMVEAARLRPEQGTGRIDGNPIPDAGSPADNAPSPAGIARARPVAAPAADGIVLARYPEWDRLQGVERPDWTCVRAVAASLGDSRRLEAELEAAPDLRRRIDRLVRAARPGRPRRLKRQPDGMELDIDAVLDAEVARAGGEVPDERLYRSSALRARDLATVVLLDVSESTRAGGVLATERLAVAMLAEAMRRLDDPFALLAFASDGRDRVQLTRIKDFAEPFGGVQRARLAGLVPGLSTRLGAALRHAGAELAGVRSFRRLVLVLTDGEPSDIDVPDPLDLVEDSRRAVLGLRSRGIDTFAVLLGGQGGGQGDGQGELRPGEANATRMFGRSGHTALRRLEDLPVRLSDLYFRLSRR
jgi:nitric oxide reductase NorD protein